MQQPPSEQLCEQLSAFLDGELPPRELELLLHRLDRDAQLRAMLGRYAAVGECMRGEPDRVSRGFIERVATAVAQEQKHQSGRAGGHSVAPQWLRTAGGLAAGIGIAATVAALAIFTLQRQTPGDAGTQIAQMGDSAPQALQSNTVVIGDSNLRGDEAPSYTVPEPATSRPVVNAARLADYVLAHSEYSSPLGRRNVLSGIIAEDPTPIDAAGAVQPAAQMRAPQSEAAPVEEQLQNSGGGALQMSVEPAGWRWYVEPDRAL